MDSKSNISEKHSSTDTNGNETAGRVEVAKTYKLYIGGSFPRTESGRYLPVKLKGGQTVNVCRASRKDLRNAIVAAQKGFAG
ncbi:MAG: hypothetical protein KDC53_21015, partial [Saprospiraceae bacterium]|nr:hypothetical protein [Saprospiraceae bacterium]